MEHSEQALQPAAAPEACSNVTLRELRDRLLQTSTQASTNPAAVQQALPLHEVKALINYTVALLKGEPTCLELTVDAPCEVVVVGDTHGQFHDVCHMLNKFGYPDENRLYIFNGDYVDRGSWGYEVLLLLLSLKLVYPTRCFLLRGNHESTTCTTWYGFKAELAAKWGKEAGGLYVLFKKLFSTLPLAAVVNQTTLILHGGLFRSVPAPGSAKAGGQRKKRKRVALLPGAEAAPLELGTLQVLRSASKGGTDPDGQGSSVVAADVLWSDPGPLPGLRLNDVRGVGLVFGPDITQEFLSANGLRLVIRSHEGPDARDKRGDLPQVLNGWSVDHNTPAGRLLTLFSAPDYPQFMAPCEKRYNNKGAVAVLSAPTWADPQLLSFEAVQPRPEAAAYYDYLAYADTDEDPAGSTDGESVAGSEMEVESVGGGAEDAMEQDDGDSAALAPAGQAGPQSQSTGHPQHQQQEQQQQVPVQPSVHVTAVPVPLASSAPPPAAVLHCAAQAAPQAPLLAPHPEVEHQQVSGGATCMVAAAAGPALAAGLLAGGSSSGSRPAASNGRTTRSNSAAAAAAAAPDAALADHREAAGCGVAGALEVGGIVAGLVNAGAGTAKAGSSNLKAVRDHEVLAAMRPRSARLQQTQQTQPQPPQEQQQQQQPQLLSVADLLVPTPVVAAAPAAPAGAPAAAAPGTSTAAPVNMPAAPLQQLASGPNGHSTVAGSTSVALTEPAAGNDSAAAGVVSVPLGSAASGAEGGCQQQVVGVC